MSGAEERRPSVAELRARFSAPMSPNFVAPLVRNRAQSFAGQSLSPSHPKQPTLNEAKQEEEKAPAENILDDITSTTSAPSTVDMVINRASIPRGRRRSSSSGRFPTTTGDDSTTQNPSTDLKEDDDLDLQDWVIVPASYD
eukprot:TRINITY_DN14117_c0_g1_i3.p1 TRINITY_DN14117_c0_g1~~TRINITY_DN14117_c0_g1_i3.p1  ORF type:complete len:141 (+),score=11.43 TRINITY_DN14117_c0_g1_i3:129-551(+)